MKTQEDFSSIESFINSANKIRQKLQDLNQSNRWAIDNEQHVVSSDEQLAQEIREAITQKRALSTIAKNIHIAVDNGVVTLEGIVFSEQERIVVENEAVSLAGFGNVLNQLHLLQELQ